VAQTPVFAHFFFFESLFIVLWGGALCWTLLTNVLHGYLGVLWFPVCATAVARACARAGGAFLQASVGFKRGVVVLLIAGGYHFSVSFSLGGVTFPNTVSSRLVFAMNVRVALIPSRSLSRYLMLYWRGPTVFAHKETFHAILSY